MENHVKKGISLFVFILILLGAICAGSPVSIFWDLPSFIISFGGTVSLLLTKFAFKEIKSFPEDVARSAINFSLLSGGLGYLIGVVQILQNFSDPSSIGPGLAVCILSVFYSLAISATIYALKRDVKFSNRLGIIGLSLALVTIAPLTATLLAIKSNG